MSRTISPGGVDLIQAHRPFVLLLDGFARDPEEGLAADRGPVDPGEVLADLTGGQPLSMQRQHDLVDPGRPSLPFLHDLRGEGVRPVTGHVVLDMTGGLGQHRLRRPVAHGSPSPDPRSIRCGRAGRSQVLGHLLVQRGLEHRLGQLLGAAHPARSATDPALWPAAPTRPRPAAQQPSSRSASSSPHRSVSWSSRRPSRRARLGVSGRKHRWRDCPNTFAVLRVAGDRRRERRNSDGYAGSVHRRR